MAEKKVSLVIVDWEDAWAHSSWTLVGKADEAHGPLPVKAVGFLIKSDEVGVSLTDGLDANGNPSGQQFIPRGMIKKIKKVKY